jgi:hypothetical protein
MPGPVGVNYSIEPMTTIKITTITTAKINAQLGLSCFFGPVFHQPATAGGWFALVRPPTRIAENMPTAPGLDDRRPGP